MNFTKLSLEGILHNYEAASELHLPKVTRFIQVLSSCYIRKRADRVLMHSSCLENPTEKCVKKGTLFVMTEVNNVLIFKSPGSQSVSPEHVSFLFKKWELQLKI